MAKDLRTGSRLIRLLQVSALVMACLGVILSILLISSPDKDSVAFYGPLILGAFALNALIIAAVLGMMAARKLVKRIKVLADAFDRGAEGDLTIRVDLGADDELGGLGKNFNGMIEKISGMVTRINASIGELRRIADRNGEASGKVMEAAKVQAEGVTQTSVDIADINRSAVKVAEGVDKLARSSAENAASIKEMTVSIAEVRRNVEAQAAAIDDVSSAIIQTAAVVEETDRNVAGLMESAHMTSKAVAEVDLSIQQVEKSIQEAATIAAGVSTEALNGKEAVEATIVGIGEIRNSSGNTFNSITRLSERVAAIGRIISMIDDVAEQTNLLALNSAIIAAQAGVHGKGFAIVSEEIKDLANRTKGSTKEIAELIQGIRAETASAVKAIRSTEKRVMDGEELSRRSGEALNRIVSGVRLVTDQVNEIARATEEQATGSRRIHGAMNNVADMVDHIASSCQEQTATSRSIMISVECMKDLTANVTASTARQEIIGKGLGESTAQMSRVVDMIREASSGQAACCERITDSVGRVQSSTESNLESARTLESTVGSLTAQIEVLRREISKLQVV